MPKQSNMLVINLRKLSLLTIGVIYWGVSSYAFQDEPLASRLNLYVTQMDEGQIEIEGKVRARIDGRYTGLPNLTVHFSTRKDSAQVELGKAQTDLNGSAFFTFDKKQLVPDEENYLMVSADFAGTSTYRPSDDEIIFKPAAVRIETGVEDSVKKITLTVYEQGEEETPVVDVEAFVLVPRMFSDLPIGSDYTDDEGKIYVDFPDDLPGGPQGKIDIKAMVEDADDYGSLVMRSPDISWGVPLAVYDPQKRALWTPNAPMWMVITFAVLMLLVWGHYVVIIFKLIKIKKEALL